MLLNGLEYKDSESVLDSIKPQFFQLLFSRAEVGSYVFFGSYEQDDITSNGKEDIEWLVLAKEGNKVLVISRYELDIQKYHNIWKSTTWETSFLRKWLNSTFLTAAFSLEEQGRIIETTLSDEDNPEYGTPAGNQTTDKIFLLSSSEANEYFRSVLALQCSPTEYAIAQGAVARLNGRNDGLRTCGWWLRSPGKSDVTAATVTFDGYISDAVVNYDSYTVRPAMWILLPEEE